MSITQKRGWDLLSDLFVPPQQECFLIYCLQKLPRRSKMARIVIPKDIDFTVSDEAVN